LHRHRQGASARTITYYGVKLRFFLSAFGNNLVHSSCSFCWVSVF
jgi:hypothetical protein